MIRYVLYLPAAGGVITQFGMAEAEHLPEYEIDGALAIEHATATPETHYVNGSGVVTEYTEPGKVRKAVYHDPQRWSWNTATEDWVDERTLEQAQEEKWEAIKVRRDVAFSATTVSAAGIAYSITLDKQNLADRIISFEAAIALSLATAADEIAWRDQVNVEHDLNLAALQGLAAEMGSRGQSIYEISWLMHQAVLAAISVAEVEEVDINDGWPLAVFEIDAEPGSYAVTGVASAWVGNNIAPALSTYVAGGTHTDGEVVGETIVLDNNEFAFRSGLPVDANTLYRVRYDGTGTVYTREVTGDYDGPVALPVVKEKLGSAISRIQVQAVGAVTITEMSVRGLY